MKTTLNAVFYILFSGLPTLFYAALVEMCRCTKLYIQYTALGVNVVHRAVNKKQSAFCKTIKY